MSCILHYHLNNNCIFALQKKRFYCLPRQKAHKIAYISLFSRSPQMTFSKALKKIFWFCEWMHNRFYEMHFIVHFRILRWHNKLFFFYCKFFLCLHITFLLLLKGIVWLLRGLWSFCNFICQHVYDCGFTIKRLGGFSGTRLESN